MSPLSRRQFLATGATGVVGAVGGTLRGCGLAHATVTRKGGHLSLGTRHDASGLDSHRYSRGHTPSLIAAIYSGLTDINRGGEITPAIAEWYEPSADLMTWTFRLRRGVLFHNGREVDADSVRQNIVRLKTATVDTTWRGGLNHIKSIDIRDKYTVRFNLSVPDVALPAGVMHGLQAPDSFEQSQDLPVGSGPFKLVSWKRHDKTRLTRFENYWETDPEGTPLPYLDTITGHYKPEREIRYTALRSGSVDLVDDLTPTQVVSMSPANLRRFQLWPVHMGGLLLAFNWRREPFRDSRLRLAAALAIDREGLHQAVFAAQGSILNQPYPRASPWHVPNVRRLTYDPDRSKSLLKEARGMGTQVVMMSGMGDSHRRRCTELIQQMWNDVGFQVRVDPLFGLQQQTRLQAGTFDAHVHHVAYAADPDYIYRGYFHSESPDAKQRSGWYNGRFSALVEAGKTSIDRSRRQALYAEAVHIINGELPAFYLHDVTATVASVRALQGFEPGEVSTLSYQGGGLRTGYLEA